MSSGPALRRLAPHLAATVLAFVVHALLWGGSYAQFARSIDFNTGALEDFLGPYYETARSMAEGGPPARGFLYGPFFALLLRPFAALDPVAASWVWLVLELGASAAVVALAWRLVGSRGPALAFTCTLLAWLSFPLVHNLHWGQVGAPLAALVLAAALAQRRGRVPLAAWILGAAIAIKGYPLLFAVPLIAFGGRRAALHLAVALLVLAVLLPALVLGPERALDVYRSSFHAIRAASAPGGAWHGAANEQFAGAVAARWLGLASPAALASADTVARLLAFLLLARSAQLARRFVRARRIEASAGPAAPRSASTGESSETAEVEAGVGERPYEAAADLAGPWVLAALALPLAVRPSWPHYLCLLPFAQLATVRARGPVLWVPALASAALSSSVFFRALGDPQAYGRTGWLAVAHLVLLPLAYRGEVRSTTSSV